MVLSPVTLRLLVGLTFGDMERCWERMEKNDAMRAVRLHVAVTFAAGDI